MEEDLVRRYVCYGNSYDCYYSPWDSWVRWVVLVVVIVAVLFLFFLFSCISARRRRRLGYSPYRGTGWALGRTPPGHGPATYNAPQSYGQNSMPYYNNSNNPPPAYSAGAANGYYGPQTEVELQQPQNVYGGYRGGENSYASPGGPPPQKENIVR